MEFLRAKNTWGRGKMVFVKIWGACPQALTWLRSRLDPPLVWRPFCSDSHTQTNSFDMYIDTNEFPHFAVVIIDITFVITLNLPMIRNSSTCGH